MLVAASVGARAARALVGLSLSCAALVACERNDAAVLDVPAPAATSSDARSALAPKPALADPKLAIAAEEGVLPVSSPDIASAKRVLAPTPGALPSSGQISREGSRLANSAGEPPNEEREPASSAPLAVAPSVPPIAGQTLASREHGRLANSVGELPKALREPASSAPLAAAPGVAPASGQSQADPERGRLANTVGELPNALREPAPSTPLAAAPGVPPASGQSQATPERGRLANSVGELPNALREPAPSTPLAAAPGVALASGQSQATPERSRLANTAGELPSAELERASSAQLMAANREPHPAADSGEGKILTSARIPDDAAYERFAGSTFRVDQIVRTLATSSFSDLRPVGTTSVVLRANLNAPFRAALKLATREHPLGPATEAAAYRLSRCLGLTTVPPVVLRRMPVTSLQQALESRSLERWLDLLSRTAVDAHDQVEAAAIFWIEGLRELPIATREARQPAQQALLQGNPVSADVQLMAAQLSDLSAFDLLLGNGDRWSGGNVQGDANGQWLYLRDHDLAFATQLRPALEEQLLTQLSHVERFSRGLIEHVRALTPESLEREWNKDEQLARPEHAAWLRDRVLPGLMGRRAKLLSYVQRLVFRYGEDAVLAYP